MMDGWVMFVFGFLIFAALLAIFRITIVTDELEERARPRYGTWRRSAEKGGPWHWNYRPYESANTEAACGREYASGSLEMSENPDPKYRCKECQMAYVLEKIR